MSLKEKKNKITLNHFELWSKLCVNFHKNKLILGETIINSLILSIKYLRLMLRLGGLRRVD